LETQYFLGDPEFPGKPRISWETQNFLGDPVFPGKPAFPGEQNMGKVLLSAPRLSAVAALETFLVFFKSFRSFI